MTTETMTAQTFRTLRTGLGVGQDWMAGHLEVNPRTVRNWEEGRSRVPPGVADAMEMLCETAAEQVDRHIEAFDAAPDVPHVIAIDEGPGDWPASWQRAIAFRVLDAVPDLIVVEADQ